MLPEMNCSNTHIKWSLPLLKSRPASCEQQKYTSSSVTVDVHVLMLTFIKNRLTNWEFPYTKGWVGARVHAFVRACVCSCTHACVQVHWYVQGWLILVKHCWSSECSHLNFCCSSVAVFKWIVHVYTRFVQKVSGLTTVHEVDKAYGVLTLIIFNIVPFHSYTLHPMFLPLLETFCKLLFRDV